MDRKVLLRIDSLLTHIDEVLEDTKDVSLDKFKSSRLLLKATCFSISQIGEQMIKLEESLKNKYPNLPWKNARGMRNFIVHDYDRIDSEQIYSTVRNDLPSLRDYFFLIKNELVQNKCSEKNEDELMKK